MIDDATTARSVVRIRSSSRSRRSSWPPAIHSVVNPSFSISAAATRWASSGSLSMANPKGPKSMKSTHPNVTSQQRLRSSA